MPLNLFAGGPSTVADIPVSFQAVIIKKIMIADPIIKAKTDGIVLIVFNESTSEKSAILKKAFNSQGMKVELTKDPNEFAREQVAVIYYMTDQIERPKFIIDYGVLTISQNESSVIAGMAALSIRVGSDAKPEIVLNRSVLEVEGHEILIKSMPKAVVY